MNTALKMKLTHTAAAAWALLALSACGGGGGGGNAEAPAAAAETPGTRAFALSAAPALPAGAAPVPAVVYRCGNVALGALRSGEIEVPAGQVCVLQGTRVEGNLKLGAGSVLDARDITVIGSLQADGAASVLVAGTSSFTGSVQLKQGGAATLLGLRIGGDLQINEHAGAVLAEANRASGNVQVMANRGGVTLLDNRAGGNLQCKDNLPAPQGSGNTAASLEDQCRSLAPAPVPAPGTPANPPVAPVPVPPATPGLPAPTLPAGVFSPGSNVLCRDLSLHATRYANVEVPAGARCELIGTQLTGNLELGPGASVQVVQAQINGSLNGDGPGPVQVDGGRIDGSVQVARAQAATINGTRIGGSLQWVAGTGLLWLQGLTLTSDLQLFGNTGGAVLNNNRAGGNLQCKDNLPAPSGSGNVAANKEDQCRGL